MLIVALDGSGDFQSIQAAIDSLKGKDPTTIFIKRGVYHEKLYLNHSHVTFIGEDAESTVITFDDYAKKVLADGTLLQTFRSYTMFIHGNHLTFSNLTFENKSGKGKDVGQAIALYVDGDCIHFKDCCFLGNQDTLFTAPLPSTPVIPGSFIGPGEYFPRKVGRHYYERCYLQGDIDFIFGGATAYFERCTIFSNAIDGLSYVTAASTPKDEAYGYVFNHCELVSDARKGSVFLGRPWRRFAHVEFLNCYLGPHIHAAGWDDWGKIDSHDSIKFYEFQNFGPGAKSNQRVNFSKELSPEEAVFYKKEKVLGNWDPN